MNAPSWRRELLLLAVFYGCYTAVRNLFGSGRVGPAVAFENAERIIDLERRLGAYIELDVQDAFIDWEWFIRFWNVFYGSAHFVVTGAVMMWLLVRRRARYLHWRRIWLAMTAVALIGYAAFPLMPPRLLDDCGPLGGCGPITGYIDTVSTIGGWWSFESEAVVSLSNQYAAMPSLHIGWACWCAWVVAAEADHRTRWIAVVGYPLATLFAITVTANHYWIDAVGGVFALVGGVLVAGIAAKVAPVAARPGESATIVST